MNGREEILSRIRARQIKAAQHPAPFVPPQPTGDLVAQFAARAATVHADVHMLATKEGLPAAVAALLRARNLPAVLHIPLQAEVDLPFDQSALTLSRLPPGPDDCALAHAEFGIAETGTLVYPSSQASPASWHFRAGFEIAVLHARDIVAHLETVLARLKRAGPLPHTVNLVSGPSRTGDIEQTLELGAHGPKALAILIVADD